MRVRLDVVSRSRCSSSGWGGIQPYQAVHLGIETTAVEIDTAQLSGGIGRFRVVASDGVNTGHADSPAVALAFKPPRPRILSPANGAVVAWGSVVTLEGEAADAQDGLVPAGSLNWANQFDVIGSGPRLSLMDLPVGLNTITLEATNSRDLTAATSITINVVDELGATNPTLSIDPPQLSFHVAAGADSILERSLEIGNFGSGSLRFNAATDGTPWLSFSGESSVTVTTPRTLAVWADPTGLSAGTTYLASLTVTPTGQPQNARTISVRLSIGNVHDTAGLGAGRGDANCDGRIGAADVSAMLHNLSSNERAPSGEDDVNGDLTLDELDFDLLDGAIFGAR